MSAKVRTYLNSEKFAAKLLNDLLDPVIIETVNHIPFTLSCWALRIELDSTKDTITIQDYIPQDDSWRNIAQLYLNDKGYLEVKVNAELNGINSRINTLIMYLILHIAHNGYKFFIF